MYVKYVELFIKSCSPRHLVKLNCVDELLARKYDKNDILKLACRYGNLRMVKYMVELGTTWWNEGLVETCSGGHMELAKYMVECGANNWNWGLMGACWGGHMELVKYMVKLGARECNNCGGKRHNFA